MSLSIPFTPDVEAKLRERAAAAGKDVGTFVREAIEEKLGLGQTAEKYSDQWRLQFDDWMRDVAARTQTYPEGFIVDDTRESIYESRGVPHSGHRSPEARMS